jgi:hypothetical protein
MNNPNYKRVQGVLNPLQQSNKSNVYNISHKVNTPTRKMNTRLSTKPTSKPHPRNDFDLI